MIDAHQHIWQLSRPECVWPGPEEGRIHRDYSMSDFRAAAGPAAAGTILVQSQESLDDSRWLLETASIDPLVAGVVGWCDLLDPEAGDRIRALARNPLLVGLRPMVQDRGAGWYDAPAIAPAIEAMMDTGLRLDALVRVRHLPSLDRLAARFGHLPIVIDHAAKPRIGDADGSREWHAAIAPIAARSNVWCKLSGLLTECGGAPPEAVAPFVAALLDLFGADRLMWGSDWPVLEAVSSYGAWLEQARSLVPEDDHGQVFERTASCFYGLSAGGTA